MSLDMSDHSSENSPLVRTEFLESSLQDTERVNPRCTRERLPNWKTNWKLYLCSFASKKGGALEAPWQMTPTRAAFVCCKACEIVAEDAFSVAIQHTIGLIDIKWGTFMGPQRRYVTWYVRETQTYSSENSPLVGTEFLESSLQDTERVNPRCTRERLHNWKTNWKLYLCSLASKKWGALEAPWQMTPTRAAFVCCKACDIVAEDAFSVAIQHSIGLIDIKWGTFMGPQRRYVTWYVRETQTYSSENSPLVRTEFLDTVRGKLQGVCRQDCLESELKTATA